MQFLAFTFSLSEEWQRDILIAVLSDLGFEGFEEKESVLMSYISEEKYSEKDFLETVTSLQSTFGFSYEKSEIPLQNWNEEWERNFPPIVIENDIVVRASFHPQSAGKKYEIIIDPKMSFGTGHHATTAMMMKLMMEENLSDKKVLDFGSGTGILSILASKLDAHSIVAIDNDQWAFENARENLALNGVMNVDVTLTNNFDFPEKQFDLVLSNINRDIITNYLKSFSDALTPEGILIVSGFLNDDEQIILAAAGREGFKLKTVECESGWMAMTFIR